MIKTTLYAAANLLLLCFAAGGIASGQERSAGNGSANQCEARPDTQGMAGAMYRPAAAGQDYASRATDLLYGQFLQAVRADAKLSDQELANQERHIWRYHHDGGCHLRMRKVAQLAGRSPCQGLCFAAVLDFIQEARVAGANHQVALTMSIHALQDENWEYRRAPTPQDKSHLVERLWTRLHIRLMDWQREEQEKQVKGLTRTKSRGGSQPHG